MMDNLTKKKKRVVYTAIAIAVGFVLIVLLSSSFIYWVKYVNGNTDAQIRAREESLKAAEVTRCEVEKMVEWHDELLRKGCPKNDYRENEE